MIDNRILQLQGEARKAGKTLIIIADDAFVMEGKGENIAKAIGGVLPRLCVSDARAARMFTIGCGSVLYAAAMLGLLGDAQVANLSEALAVARAHKKGGKN